MAFKIYRSGNYINIKNTETNSLYDYASNLLAVDRPTDNSTTFNFVYNGEALPFLSNISINDIQDENGNPYTLEEFETFYKNKTSGNASQIDYRYDVGMGNVDGAITWNIYGHNEDVDTGGQQLLAPWNGVFNPINDIITAAQTFTITYNNTTDGLATTGALSLLIYYIDENFKSQTAIHTLGGTGTDVTTFTGLGINRVVVYSNGGLGYNVNDITFTATTDGSKQALIVAGSSVTQQCFFHTDINSTFLTDWLSVNVLKLSGGGAPKVDIRGYSYSRVTQTKYEVMHLKIDTSVENNVQLIPSQPFIVGGREFLYFTAETDSNNTEVEMRFSGIEINN